MSKRQLTWLVVASGVAVCGYFYAADRLASARIDNGRTRELAALRAQVASLSGTVASLDRAPLRQQDVSPVLVAQPEQPKVSATAADASSATSAHQATRQATDEEQRDHLEAAFTSEDTDPTWSRAQGRTLNGQLTSVLPRNSAISSYECKSSLCRVETTHENLEAYRKFVHAGFLDAAHPVDMGPMMTTLLPAAAGRIVAVSYIAREGRALPTLEADEQAQNPP